MTLRLKPISFVRASRFYRLRVNVGELISYCSALLLDLMINSHGS